MAHPRSIAQGIPRGSLPLLLACCLGEWLGPHPATAASPPEKLEQEAEALRQSIQALPSEATAAARRGQLLEKLGDLERGRRREGAAAGVYRQALEAYTTAASGRKRQLLLRLSRPAPGFGDRSARSFKDYLDNLTQATQLHQRCLGLPRRDKPPASVDARLKDFPRQIGSCREAGNRHKDPQLLAFALECEARLAASRGDLGLEEGKLRKAIEGCARLACPATRRRLRLILQKGLEARAALREAFEVAAQHNADLATELPEPLRLHHRGADLLRLCERLRALPESPPCRDLERKATGSVTYRDFSLGPTRPSLSADVVKPVHDEYLPLLIECLTRAVKDGELEAGDELELSWTVKNDGHTTNLERSPPGDEPGLTRCLGAAVEAFRYPRFPGQRQNITLPLSVGRF